MTTVAESTTGLTVGDRVEVQKDAIGPWLPATIVRDFGDGPYRYVVRFDDIQHGVTLETYEHGAGCRTVTPADAIRPLRTDDAPSAADLRAEIIRLRADVELANGRARQTHERHLSDIRAIGQALKETADRNEWCGEYDRQVANLIDSGALSTMGAATLQEVALREQEYRVEVEVTIRTSVVVTAMDEDSAADIVRDDPSSYIDPYALSCDNIYDISVTDVGLDY